MEMFCGDLFHVISGMKEVGEGKGMFDCAKHSLLCENRKKIDIFSLGQL